MAETLEFSFGQQANILNFIIALTELEIKREQQKD